jgi:protein TonB
MTSEQSSLIPPFTLVVWMTCLAAGVVGLYVPYPRPRAAAIEPPAVEAQTIKVDITNQPKPAPQVGLPAAVAPADAAELQPPPPPDAAAAAPPPELMAVATPAIAFAQPVAGPTHIVAPRQAVPVAARPVAPPPAPVTRHITFGQGEGDQPAPEYPREAVMNRQEGTVVVFFTVGADGSVLMAKASVPCPWPLLNQAAVRAVRDTWRFPPGAPRSYDVSIQFQLVQR